MDSYVCQTGMGCSVMSETHTQHLVSCIRTLDSTLLRMDWLWQGHPKMDLAEALTSAIDSRICC